MSSITVTIQTDGAAFRPGAADGDNRLNSTEVRVILAKVAQKIDDGEDEGVALDTNGNAAATFRVTEDD